MRELQATDAAISRSEADEITEERRPFIDDDRYHDTVLSGEESPTGNRLSMSGYWNCNAPFDETLEGRGDAQ